jgi:hypothetical protein
MLRGMTFRQFCEWRAYADIEPFDETRGDLRAAQIVATLRNLYAKKGAPLLLPTDVVLRFGSTAPPAAGPVDKAAQVEKQRQQIRTVLEGLVKGQAAVKRSRLAKGKRG